MFFRDKLNDGLIIHSLPPTCSCRPSEKSVLSDANSPLVSQKGVQFWVFKVSVHLCLGTQQSNSMQNLHHLEILVTMDHIFSKNIEH